MENLNLKIIANALLFTFGCLTTHDAESRAETGVFLSAKAETLYDDNIFRLPVEQEQSDVYFRVTPNARLIGKMGKHDFSALYAGDYSAYSDIASANYDDHKLSASGTFSHTPRLETNIGISFIKEHVDPSALSEVLLGVNEYTRYEQTEGSVGLTYGRIDSIGRITIEYENLRKKYLNNGFNLQNYDADQLNSLFFYRLAPKTQIYTRLSYSDYNYTETQIFDRDNSYKFYGLGLKWDANAIISRDVNIGYQARKYNSSRFSDVNGLSFNGTLHWNITNTTSLEFAGKRDAIDSLLEEGGGILRTFYSVDAKHSLSRRMALNIVFEFINDDIRNANQRNDDIYRIRANTDFTMTSRINVGINYSYTNRKSSFNVANFENNIVGIHITVTLDK